MVVLASKFCDGSGTSWLGSEGSGSMKRVPDLSRKIDPAPLVLSYALSRYPKYGPASI